LRGLDRLDAKAKMLSVLLTGIAVLRAREPVPLAVAVLLAYPILRRRTFTPGVLLILSVSLLGGLDYFVRLLAVAELGLLFAETTGEGEIIGALTRMKLPSDVALSVGMAINGFHSLRRLFGEVSEAQASRGMKGGFTAVKSTVVPVIVRALVHGEELGEAVEARAYSGKLKLPHEGKFGPEEAVLVAGSAILLAVSLM
jgi:energy-coupling factor transport system permease protein